MQKKPAPAQFQFKKNVDNLLYAPMKKKPQGLFDNNFIAMS